MTPYAFHTVDVFTDRPFTGNPLAVFPDGRGLSPAQMQLVAREINYSETVFVLPAERPGHTVRLRIFTPEEEIRFAGHPTIGTAWVLASVGRIQLQGERTRVVLEEQVGPVPVMLTQRNERLQRARLTAARLPEEGPPPPATPQLARALGLEPNDILAGDTDRPRSFTCGTPFVFVPVRDLDALGRASVHRRAFEQVLGAFWSPMVFLMALDRSRPDAPIRARTFAPLTGVPEDPATGSAVAALGGYLADSDSADGTHQWVVEQGIEMGRPSRLELTVDRQGGAVTAVHVGGRAVMVASGEMRIPAED